MILLKSLSHPLTQRKSYHVKATVFWLEFYVLFNVICFYEKIARTSHKTKIYYSFLEKYIIVVDGY